MKIVPYIRIQTPLLLLVTFSIISLMFASKGTFTASAQTINKTEKKITKESFKNEPIEFVELKTQDKAVNINQQFTQENDWLKNFTIKLKNISNKPIVCVSVNIGFPETESTGKRMVDAFNYGINPLALPNTYTNSQPALLPNEMAELRLSEEKGKRLEDFLASRQHSVNELTKIHLTIMAVYFDDGTHWSAGTVFRPDPNRPGKFIADNDKTLE